MSRKKGVGTELKEGLCFKMVWASMYEISYDLSYREVMQKITIFLKSAIAVKFVFHWIQV
jgi:hypothetical protein